MHKSRNAFLSAWWLTLALLFLPVLRAQETPPPPPPAEPVTPAEPAAPVEKTDEAPPAEEAKPASEEKKSGGELRELGTDHDKPVQKKTTRSRSSRRGDAPPFGDHSVSAGNTRHEVVSVFGNTTVDGHVTEAAVSVLGSTTVNGTVDGEAVSVFGNSTINGTVKGESVTVFGNLKLGPEAVVNGDTVVVFGKIERAPGAQLHGNVQEIGRFGPFQDFTGLHVWFNKCLMMARPLAFDSRLLWAWSIAFGFLAFYALIALIAPAGVLKCVETLEQRPGYSLLSALLTMLLTPVAYLLLVLTLTIVIGIVLVPLFSMGLFFAAIFGKIVMLAWLGRRITRLAGDGPLAHPVFGVLIGGLIILLLYTIPIAGFILYKLLGILGLGVVVYTVILQYKASRPVKPAPVTPMSTVIIAPAMPGVAGMAAAPGAAVMPEPAAPPVMLPPVISAATLQRVGFWHRLAASVLDAILVGMMCGFLSNMWHGFEVFPFWYALYCVIMWATKGTTIGGIICGLRLVRIDDRPIDWSVAIVRALGAFLSLFVAGLGFIWVAFDDEKQSWHDKIAGTTIVRVPKGTPLL
jgi:uncharacterized RDD family membrane protein YckC/cytoskeletal protein CcmA (bactofilin family)